MKLYATTISERASKGQGGKWLDIEIRNEQKRLLAIITIRSKEPQSAVIGIVNAPDVKVDTMIEKGKSQKGEKLYCTKCGYVEAQTTKNCKECGAEMFYKI